jgi:hypothetical protein
MNKQKTKNSYLLFLGCQKNLTAAQPLVLGIGGLLEEWQT